MKRDPGGRELIAAVLGHEPKPSTRGVTKASGFQLRGIGGVANEHLDYPALSDEGGNDD